MKLCAYSIQASTVLQVVWLEEMTAQGSFQLPIGLFHLTICLGVKTRSKINLCAKNRIEIPPDPGN